MLKTDKQKYLAQLVVTGLTPVEIAEEIGNQPNTVRRQIHLLCKKYGVRTRARLTAELFRDGYMPLGDRPETRAFETVTVVFPEPVESEIEGQDLD